jgi:hypothetical protein
MSKYATRRAVFMSALAGVLVGALLVGTLVTILPADAATGDRMVLGRANQAGLATKMRSKGPSTLKLINTRGPGGVALELNTPAGIPPMRVNRAAWVQNLNADLLDGRQAWDLTRAAYGMVDGWAMSPPANGHVVATTITAPNAGLLVMSGSFDTMTIHSPVYDHFDCFLKVDGAEVGGSRRTMDFQYDNTWDPLHGDYGTTEMNCATDGVARVNAGKHNVVLAIASNHAGAIRDAAVWAIYVPFDASGNVP